MKTVKKPIKKEDKEECKTTKPTPPPGTKRRTFNRIKPE